MECIGTKRAITRTPRRVKAMKSGIEMEIVRRKGNGIASNHRREVNETLMICGIGGNGMERVLVEDGVKFEAGNE